MIQKETVEYIWKFLQSKPVEIRKIFYLYYYMNLSIAEIAEALSTKESTIKNKLYRTINEFRNRYREEL
jgi:RNA polymerase sigma-70 factor (ECF subfamily)